MTPEATSEPILCRKRSYFADQKRAVDANPVRFGFPQTSSVEWADSSHLEDQNNVV